MISLSIAVTLLTLILSVYFIAKIKNDFTGSLFKVVAYGVFSSALILLFFLLYQSFRHQGYRFGQHMMMHENYWHNSDYCNDNHMNYDYGTKKYKRKLKKQRIGQITEDDSAEVIFESSVDTIDGKIIKKEIEIIRE